MFLASYDGEPVSNGAVRVLRDVESDLAGRDVVIVDDILDSGRTLAFAKARLMARGAKRVLSCVLVDKQVPRAVAIEPDFSGFVCPPVFVVGYGMDLAQPLPRASLYRRAESLTDANKAGSGARDNRARSPAAAARRAGGEARPELRAPAGCRSRPAP